MWNSIKLNMFSNVQIGAEVWASTREPLKKPWSDGDCLS